MNQDETRFEVVPISSVDDLEREWRFLETVATPSFFQTWRWMGTLLEVIPPETHPLLLRGTVSGRTVALALLGQHRTRRHRWFGGRRWVLNATGDPALDSIYIEHNGLLAQTGIGWDGLIELFSSADDVDELVLPGVVIPPPPVLVERRNLLRRDEPEESFAVSLAELDAAGGDVTTILSRNARSQLRRAIRRLEPLQLEAAKTESEALELFDVLKGLHIPWWERRGQPHAFIHPFFERFHRRLIARDFEEGGVELLRVSSADRLIGVLYNFRQGDHVYAYQSGFVEPLDNERPGVVAHARAIEHAWRGGAKVYDFMAGENQLKRSFANCTSTLSWIQLQKPYLGVRAENWARLARTRLVASRTTAQSQ